MRELTGHQVSGVNDGINLTVRDEPGSGNACHKYIASFTQKDGEIQHFAFTFQNGPIKEKGVNGITHEILLEIIKDRLKGFQSGQYACADNAEALAHVEAAQECLLRRTRARAARGVEGTMAV